MIAMADQLTIALAKGRVLDETLPLLARSGIEPADDLARSRKLIFATNQENIRLLLIRSADVATYVQYVPLISAWSARTCCWNMAVRGSTSVST